METTANSNTMATAADAPVFPDELTTEILSWLPVKSLMRFRCVCSEWNSLFSNPSFVKLHLERSPKNTHTLLTFCHVRGHFYTSAYAICSTAALLENPAFAIDHCYYGYEHRFFIFGVCNGLACMIDSKLEGLPHFVQHRFRFLNPATRLQSQPLELLVSLSKYKWEFGEGDMKIGFGYDDWSDTYKVVVVLLDSKLENLEVKVYCLGGAGWRNTLTCPVFPIIGNFYGWFVSGKVNWLALHRSSPDYQWETVAINELVIFSYDIKDDTYRYLSMPNGLAEVPTSKPVIGVLKGCMCLSHDHRGSDLVVWIMREFGDEGSWAKLLNISYEHFQILPWPKIPLCMSENDEVFLLENNEGAEFVLYNGGDNRLDHAEAFKPNKSLFRTYDYVQSLVLP